MRFTTGLVLIVAGVVSACDNSESYKRKEVTEKIILHSADEKRPLYKLSILSEYVAGDKDKQTVLIKTTYPGIIGFSPEIKHRFYDEDGTWASDLVKIFIGIRPEYQGNDREFRNRNDAGKFSLESMVQQNIIFSGDVSSTIKKQEKVKRVIFPNEKIYQKTYVVNHDNGRVAVIHCPYKISCEGTTSWKGKIAVSYQFRKDNLPNLVDLDNSVIDLIDTFKPTLIIDEQK